MGRYLIIDTEKIEEQTSENVWLQELLQSTDNPILSEEESLAKFKEVWINGFGCGTSEEEYDEDYRKRSWNDIKVTL